MKNKFNKSFNKTKLFTYCLIISFIAAGIFPTNIANEIIEKPVIENIENNDHPLSVMRPDFKTLIEWKDEYESQELAFIDSNLKTEIHNTEEFSILAYLDYIPEERDQGWCSNCWAWPATAIVGIALYIQKNVFNRLSVQYINSCGEEVGIECCEGGNLNDVVRFYRYTDKAIPWSNTNAYWQDIRARCNTECSSISTIPNYPITSILPKSIKTHNVPKSEAIENIKNILHQERGVYFTVFYPTSGVLSNFQEFWRDDPESRIYDLDYANGVPINEEDAAGHALLCVGYFDDPDSNQSDYWILLNSWGTTYQRPNGLLRVDMHMDYDCSYPYNSGEYYAFGMQTLQVEFKEDLESPYPPELDGETNGLIDDEYIYTISAIDPQENDLYYFIDWGDGTNTGWIGLYDSGEEIQVSHTWGDEGDYVISAQAKDTNNAESDWVTLEIKMPKNIDINSYNLLELFMEFLSNFPLLFNIINNFI